jgi:hypothetical protein
VDFGGDSGVAVRYQIAPLLGEVGAGQRPSTVERWGAATVDSAERLDEGAAGFDSPHDASASVARAATKADTMWPSTILNTARALR